MPFLLHLKPAYLSADREGSGQPTITAARFRPMINYIRFQNWLRAPSLRSTDRPTAPIEWKLRRLRLRRDAIFHREHDVFKLAAAAEVRSRRRSWSYILPQLRTGYPFSREGQGRGSRARARCISPSSVYFIAAYRYVNKVGG